MPILPTPLPAHPRLLADAADFTRLKSQIATDPTSAKIFAALKTKAESLLTTPPITRAIVGPRLIAIAQRAIKHVATLALVYQLTNDPRFAARGKTELLAIADFSDFNPSHFLDAAELSVALAIGLDWLHDTLDEPSRQKIATAIIDKALLPSLIENPLPHWHNSKSNWSPVCYGGTAVASIAIAERDPALAEKLLTRALEKVPRAAAEYAPDGAYPAGPTYWNYGTEFLVLLIAALEKSSAAQSAHPLDTAPGLANTGQYINDMTTPTGDFYCYSDDDRRRDFALPLFWLAPRYHRPDWLAFDLSKLDFFLEEFLGGHKAKIHAYRFLPFALLWHKPIEKIPTPKLTSALYLGPAPVAILRSCNAGILPASPSSEIYVGLKGGHAASDHGHMDPGSFILETDNVRWALDLGREDYHHVETHGVPDLWNMSQNSQRWSVFRIGPAGHSLARFGDTLQLVNAIAEFTNFSADEKSPFAIVNLSPTHAHAAASHRRGIKILAGTSILIQDEYSAATAPFHWQFITESAPTLTNSHEILLRQSGQSLTLKILDALPVTIQIESADALLKPHDSPLPTVKRITITCDTPAATLRILAIPGNSPAAIPAPAPLATW